VTDGSEYRFRSASPYLLWDIITSHSDQYGKDAVSVRNVLLAEISIMFRDFDTKVPKMHETVSVAKVITAAHRATMAKTSLIYVMSKRCVSTGFISMNRLIEVNSCPMCCRFEIPGHRSFLCIKGLVHDIPLCSCKWYNKHGKPPAYINAVTHVSAPMYTHVVLVSSQRRTKQQGIKWDHIISSHDLTSFSDSDRTACAYFTEVSRWNYYATLFRIGFRRSIPSLFNTCPIRNIHPPIEAPPGAYLYERCKFCREFVSNINPCTMCGKRSCYWCSLDTCPDYQCLTLKCKSPMRVDPTEFM